ncbi:putative mitogen-activated protein kinase kinase kinase NPK1 [Iris pallida]|uniref:Mitogen-activated protein kinase kinase kinase NPK1 n=1 Tax=Iris pallida TaxID=29817 RepID=A0AAX6IKA2_IRIPA|nr:putative mitogen-activated protein kinase kinase kinase NPK1 [Iris pallida]
MEQRPGPRPRLHRDGQPRLRHQFRRPLRRQVRGARPLLCPAAGADDPLLSRFQARGVLSRTRPLRRPLQPLPRVRSRRLPRRRAPQARRQPPGALASVPRAGGPLRPGLLAFQKDRPLRHQEPEHTHLLRRRGEDRGPRLREALRRGRVPAGRDAHVHGARGRQRGAPGARSRRVGGRVRGGRDGHRTRPVAGHGGRDLRPAPDRVLGRRAGDPRVDVRRGEGLPRQVLEEGP